MAVVIALLRGVNLGSAKRMKMDALRLMHTKLGLKDVQTHVQSGNVVFRCEERELETLAARIESAIEKTFGFKSAVVLRTAAELRDVIARNPFAGREFEGSKLLVTFLACDPGEEARAACRKVPADPEELFFDGREHFIYFPNGMGRSKLAWGPIEKALKTIGTGRNWNTVTKLLEMAEKLEANE